MKIYLVGGAVRDKILGLPVKDRDYVVVGSSPEEMIKLGYKPIGKNFPVFLHPETQEEYALARTEKKIGKGYHGFEFFTSPNVTLKQDLSRRDITINAIAEDENGNIYDPYNGIKDIEKKIIRHVSDAFVEDPLRVFRVARFFARFEDFEIHEDTEDLMKKIVNNGEIKFLSIERIKNELLKGLEEKYVDKMFLSFNQCGVLKEILPDFSEENKKLNSFLFSLLIELRNTPNTFSAESKLLMVLLLLVINNVDKSNYKNYVEYFKLSNNACIKFKGIENEAKNLENYLSLSLEDKLDCLYRLDFFRRPNLTLEILDMIMFLITANLQSTAPNNLSFRENFEEFQRIKKIIFGKVEKVKNYLILFQQKYSKFKTKVDALKSSEEIKQLIYKERLSILKKID